MNRLSLDKDVAILVNTGLISRLSRLHKGQGEKNILTLIMKYYGIARAPWWPSGTENHTGVDAETTSVVFFFLFYTCIVLHMIAYFTSI